MNTIGGNDRAPRITPARKTNYCVLLAIAGATLLLVPYLLGQSSKPTDYQVKAVYLINFAKFIEWPDKAQDAFTICVVGRDPFGPTLDALLAGEKIAGRSAIAKRISTPEDSPGCQILFVSATETSSLNRIIAALDKQSVLTVSDIPHFTSHGGMIQFVVEDKRIRFEVNLTAAQHAGLMLSSELLKVATAVRRNPTAGD